MKLFLILLSFLSSYCFAEFDAVLVTANKTETLASTIPGNVSVISKAQIENLHGLPIDEILKKVSGVNSNRQSLSDMRPVVTLRRMGTFEQGRTLVLLDGVPLNKADNGDVNWNRIDPNTIERIEVVKGPASAMYGSHAMGGVINIISKQTTAKSSAKTSLTAATHDSYTISQTLAGKPSQHFFYNLAGQYEQTNGYHASSDYDRANNADQGFINIPNKMNQWKVSSKIGLQFNQSNSLTLDASRYEDERIEGKAGDGDPKGEYRNFDTDAIKLTYKNKKDLTSFHSSFYYQKESYYKLYDRISPRDDTNVNSDRVDFGLLNHITLSLSKMNKMGAGIDFKRGQVDAADRDFPGTGYLTNKGKIDLIGTYLQDEITLFNGKYILLAGVRLDYARFYDGDISMSVGQFPFSNAPATGTTSTAHWSALSPRLSGRLFLDKNLSIYHSYSRGFRPPELDDLSRTGYQYVGPKIANPDLKPETLDTLELGMDIKTKRIHLKSDIYYSLGHDFLYYVDTGEQVWGSGYWATRTYQVKENVGKVRIMGFEFSLAYHPVEWIKFTSNYSLAKSKITEYQNPNFSGSINLEGKELRNTPRHLINTGIDFYFPIVNFSFTGQWKSAYFTDDANTENEKTDDYFLFDFTLWKKMKNGLGLSLAVKNILDNRHTDTPDGLKAVNSIDYSTSSYNPGRTIIANLSYSY